MKNLILISMPAAGKGTLSKMLKEKLGYITLSTGEILRNKAKEDSDLQELLNSGKLLDDNIIISLVKEEILKIKNKPFILDGFPRTLNQAKEFDKILEEISLDKPLVINLVVERETAKDRLLGRMFCSSCGRGYNSSSLEFKPKNENLCDDCNLPLVKRGDDTEETVLKRFEEFDFKTKDLLDYYKDYLVEVDANKSALEVFKATEKILG